MGVECAAVEQGWGGRGKEETGQEFIKLDGTFVFLLPFVEGESKSDPHPEELRRLDSTTADMDQISIINGLKSHVIELQVTLRLQCSSDFFQIKLA